MSARGGGRSQQQRGGGGSAARGRGRRGRGGRSGSPQPGPEPPAPRPVPSAPSPSHSQPPASQRQAPPAALMPTPSPAPAAARVPTPIKPSVVPSSSTQVSTAAAAEKLAQEVTQKLALVPKPPPASQPQAPPAALMPTPSPATAAARVPTPIKPSVVPSSSTQVSTAAAAEKLAQEVTQKFALVPNPPPASSKAMRFPVRPGFGTKGTKCLIRANHFVVSVADKDLHQYDVTISPEVSSKAVNRRIISQLLKMYRQSHMGNRLPAYDGRKSLYTAGQLPFESKEFVVSLENDGQGRRERKPREFKVVIKFASKPDLHHLQQFLKSRQLDIPQETIQVLDVVLRELPSNEYVLAGKSFFSHTLGEVVKFQDGLECWRGYYQSLRPTQMGLSLNIDVSARSFFQTILVHDFVKNYLNRDVSRGLNDQDRTKVRKALNGVKIEVTHMEYPKTYKITGISKETMGRLTFSTQDGRKASVVQYFREKYNIVLKCLMLPCLQAGSGSNPTYLPMELCRFVKGQRYTSKLNEKQVSALLKETCQRPSDREKNIKKMVMNNNYSKDPLVNDEYGIRVSDELTLVEARVLPPPMLKYHGGGREATISPQVGVWNMMHKKMVNGGKVGYWTCVSFSSRFYEEDVHEFCRRIVEMCTSKGMAFNPNPVIPVRTADARQIERTLVHIHTESTKKISSDGNAKSQLQLLLVILPDVSGSYGRIKTLCETELGIVSQCCQPNQVMKWSGQYFENVALKINVKVGGRNNVLFDALHSKIPNFNDAPTIVFGADVTHPAPGEDSSPSIAAVVASMDWPEVTKYRALVSAQPHREEIIQDLYKLVQETVKGVCHGGMIREHIKAFRVATGLKPCRIIFYRDGVSEGQFSQVLLHEVDAIRRACNSLEEGYLPKITFVVVQKRHHTRLFAANHNDRRSTDRSGNILPGTVVDSQICHPTEFDFYLNSHAGIKGTSKPTHYHVLFDENNFSADLLQMLTNSLCYTYVRCTRAVSVVPPAYYAHLAAFRARHYIEGGEASASASTAAGAGGTTSRERVAEVRPLPAIKENVKEVMFYC